MQNPFGDTHALGVVYITSMNRPDAALALSALHGFEGRRESRMGSICVVGAGLDAAIFCDMVGHLYMVGPMRNSNSVLPVGLAAVEPLPPNPVMVRTAIERRNEKDEPQYAHSIRIVNDTSVPEAVIRNGVTLHAGSVIILSAPATYLAKSLDLLGVREIYKSRVQRLVIVDSGAPQQDVPALRRVLAEWPTPVVLCGREVGETLLFPGAPMQTGFSWTPVHPVVDAYRAFKPMPYDAPSYDLAAAHYAVHPDSGFFRLSEPGSISVSGDGRVAFSADAAGNARSLLVEPSDKERAIGSFVEIVTAKPVPPPARPRRSPDAAAAALKPAAKDPE